jgi:hypothetical protein
VDVLRTITLVLFVLGVTAVAMATPIPEIDPGTGVNALALLGGALLVIRGRRRR